MEIRNKTISLRISDEEYKELNRLCEKVSLDKSGLIRHALSVFETAYDIVKRHDEEEETKLEIDMNNEEFEYLNNLCEKVKMDKIDLIKQSLKSFELVYDIIESKKNEPIHEYEPVHCEEEPDYYTIQLPINNGILSGKNNGKLMRNKLNLDKLEEDDKHICLSINSNILSFNTSYFLGLFKDSKNKYKTINEFLQKYEFKCNCDYIMKDIMDGIKSLYNTPFWKRR